MPVFFAFSDESGKYKKERSDKFISKNPYYCRSAVILESHDWLKLREEFYLLKKNFLSIDRRQEVKWSYIWSLYKQRQKGEKIPPNKPYVSLRHHPLDKLVEFIRRVLRLLNECRDCRIIMTVTFNERQKTKPLESKEMLKLHLSHVLEVTQKEISKIPESICVLFLNREEPALEREMKEVFFEIYRKAPSRKYSHIKNSLNFEYLPYSFGSQLADYCGGVLNGCLRLYPQSIDLFRHQIWPKIPKEKNRELGYGLTEIPKNLKNRAYLKRILGKVFAAEEGDYRISIEERLKS